MTPEEIIDQHPVLDRLPKAGRGSYVAVPHELWSAAAEIEATKAGLTVHKLLYHEDRKCVAARYRFWRTVRSKNYSFTAIANVTGHNHASVIYGLNSLIAIELGVRLARPGRYSLARAA